jgi:hypothetical protein
MYAALKHKLKYEGRFAEAADAVRRAVRFRPGDADAHVELGRVLASWLESLPGAGERPDAPAREDLLEELSRVSAAALAIAPGAPAALALRSKLLEFQGDLQAASEVFRQAIAIEEPRVDGAGESAVPAVPAVWTAGRFEVRGPLFGSCVNSADCEFGVGVSWDGTKLFHGAGRPGKDDRLALHMAVWSEAERAFTGCRELGGVNTRFWEGGATLSADGQTLYFDSTRLAGGAFVPELYTAAWDEAAQDFVDPRPLGSFASIRGMAARPAISVEGHELHFATQTVPRSRNIELWVAWRHSLGEPFTPERARPLEEINSPHDETSPVLSRDGKHLLWTGWITDSHAGGGDFQSSSIWCATRSEAFDPRRHAEPPRFEAVHRVALSPPVHAHTIAISGTWPAPGAKAYFVGCLATECQRLCDVMDIYEAAWQPAARGMPFLRGDANDDGRVDIADAVATLSSLFLGQARAGCDDAADANDDGEVDLSDAAATLATLLLLADPLPPPGTGACGLDPTEDPLDCLMQARCP